MSVPTAAPLVSIIVPSYNQGRYLRATLDSILAQDYRPLEVLVVDGASKDESVAILTEYGGRHPELRWWSEPDRGVADAVNKGLERALGTIGGILSSDDLYLPGAVRAGVAVLAADPAVGIACADIDIIDETGRRIGRAPPEPEFTAARFLSRNMIIHQGSAFFRLALAREVGGWRPEYFCADTEMWLRMSFRAPVRKVDAAWSAWRRHAAQRNTERVKMWDSWGRMVEESAELKGAPLPLRLAARAGRHMVALRYNPGRSRWFVAAQAWLAVLTYPPSFLGMRPKSALVPGLARLRRLVLRAQPASDLPDHGP